MLAPVPSLSKEEILYLYRHMCKHGHRYLNHYQCYLNEKGQEEKVGFIDIETSNLKANFGIIFSYCIKEHGKNVFLEKSITKDDLQKGILDRDLVKQCIVDMQKFHRLVGHYSSRFDIPYLRTRALYWKLDFPKYGEILHTDVWKIARNVLCLSSNRQGVIAETILGHSGKTRIDPKHWIMALQGDPDALAYIVKHNKIDAKELEKNYDKLIGFSKRNSRSI